MFKLFNRYDQTPGGVNVAATEVKQRLDRGDTITLLDVREQWEYDTARINGAKLIPMRELETRKTELNPNDEIVVYCHMGVRSLKAIHYLQQHGFTNLKNLSGGSAAGRGARGPGRRPLRGAVQRGRRRARHRQRLPPRRRTAGSGPARRPMRRGRHVLLARLRPSRPP